MWRLHGAALRESMTLIVKVASKTQKGVEYTVRKLDTGEWKCSCPGFVFHDKADCKHIKAIKNPEPEKTEEQKAEEEITRKLNEGIAKLKKLAADGRHKAMKQQYGSIEDNPGDAIEQIFNPDQNDA